MNSLPIVHLLLLLLGLGLQSFQAQGMPVNTNQDGYKAIIDEIEKLLNSSAASPPHLSATDRSILMDNTLLRPNLDAFLSATKNLTQKEVPPIRKNLKTLRAYLPKATPQATSVSFKYNWEDFRNKLYEYLQTLRRCEALRR